MFMLMDRSNGVHRVAHHLDCCDSRQEWFLWYGRCSNGISHFFDVSYERTVPQFHQKSRSIPLLIKVILEYPNNIAMLNLLKHANLTTKSAEGFVVTNALGFQNL